MSDGDNPDSKEQEPAPYWFTDVMEITDIIENTDKHIQFYARHDFMRGDHSYARNFYNCKMYKNRKHADESMVTKGVKRLITGSMTLKSGKDRTYCNIEVSRISRAETAYT